MGPKVTPSDSAEVIPIESLVSQVRVVLAREEITLRDGPVVRAAVDLLRTIEVTRTPAREVDRQGRIYALAGALNRFARAVLGPEANAEVVEGWAYVALMHIMRGQEKMHSPRERKACAPPL
jgi:hypothetical protein